MYFQTRVGIVVIMILFLSLTGCDSSLFTQQEGQVSTKIISNTHVGPIPVDQEITITSNSQDTRGIRQVDFIVNGILIDTQIPPFPDVQFIVNNRWTPPGEGEYMIKIVAYGPDDQTAEDMVKVVAKHGIIPVATSITAEATRPASTPPPSSTAIACGNNAFLVRDVTIPDGTTLDPSQTFNKTWLIRNTGTCPWVNGYYFDHVAGPALGGTRLNLNPVGVGAEINVTVPMVAPSTGGTYRSDWRLFDAAGRAFGPTFRVEIMVPQTCEAPRITLFEANPTTINTGQNSTLRWTVVGAVSLSLNPGPQLTSADGSATVSPSNTTTYILEARTGDCVDTRQVTVFVNPVGNRPAAPSNLQVTEVGQTTLSLSWIDRSNNETEFRLFNANTNQHLFTYAANAIEGQVTGLICNTEYRWQLYAYNSQGLSDPSNITTIRTNACN